MELGHDENQKFTLSKFESMLKTNDILFFDSDEFELIINHYLETGKFNLAKKATKIALSQHPHSVELKLSEVEILTFENKLLQAQAILNSLMTLDASNPDIYIHKANILSKQEEHREAIELLKKADELLDEDDDEVHSLIAMEYLFLEEYEKAKDYFIKCLKVNPEDYTALYNIVYCFDFMGKTQESIAFLNDYIDENPYSEVAWHQMGLQYMNLKDYKQALACFEYSIISDDQFTGAYIEKGKALEKLKRYSEAIECYQSTLGTEDAGAYVYLRIGKCYEKIGEDELGLDYYNKALQVDPLSDKTWTTVTDFYIKKEQYKKALGIIERALTLDEDNVRYWKRYAKINKQLRKLTDSKTGKEMRHTPDFESWITRCDILIEVGNYKTAIDCLKEAQVLFPKTAEIEYRFAGLYLSLGKKKSGLSHLRKGLNIDKEYVVILKDLFPKIYKKKEIQDLL